MSSGKAHRFYRLIGAEVLSCTGFGAVHVSLTLNSRPVMSKRIWFPMRSLRNYGKDQLWASEWIIGVKNKKLKQEGETAFINLDPESQMME